MMPWVTLKTVDYSDSTPDVSFTYDARHDLASMNDGIGLTTFTNTPSGLFQRGVLGSGLEIRDS